MATQEEIRQKLVTLKPFLRKNFGVDKIGFFGSYARGEQTPNSDLDILVEFDRPIGWEVVDFIEYLEEVLHKGVDLVTVRALKPQLKDKILDEVIYA